MLKLIRSSANPGVSSPFTWRDRLCPSNAGAGFVIHPEDYLWNNSLKYTDPSGESVFDAIERFLDILFAPAKANNELNSWIRDHIDGTPRDEGYFRKGYIFGGELPYSYMASNNLPPSQTIAVDGSRIMGGQVGSAGFTDASGQHYPSAEYERAVRLWEQAVKNAANKSVPAQKQQMNENIDPYAGGGPLMASLDGYIGTEPEKESPAEKTATTLAPFAVFAVAEPTPFGEIALGIAATAMISYYMLNQSGNSSFPGPWVQTQPDPTKFPYQSYGNNNGGGGNDWMKWAVGGSLAGGTEYLRQRHLMQQKRLTLPSDNTYVQPPSIYPYYGN